MALNSQFIKLNKKIIACKKCKRLKNFREKIAKEKRKQYINEKYWGKPITGFGDLSGKVLLVGLAPAAHGGNRTGRVFTGDRSAEFLYKCLYKVKMSNQSTSENKNDGLKLYNSYITTALKCVPPGDKPTFLELRTCFGYFKEEIDLLKNVKIIIALGKIAFDACIQFYKETYFLKNNYYKFSHGAKYQLPDKKILIGCYHPSLEMLILGELMKKK
tara:strand:+ start:197 stop:844 length:648 start_codon:yes stop_codon:yes gene_type:complete